MQSLPLVGGCDFRRRGGLGGGGIRARGNPDLPTVTVMLARPIRASVPNPDSECTSKGRRGPLGSGVPITSTQWATKRDVAGDLTTAHPEVGLAADLASDDSMPFLLGGVTVFVRPPICSWRHMHERSVPGAFYTKELSFPLYKTELA